MPGGWLEAWDSIINGGLPHAVECSIWFKPWPDEELPEWMPLETEDDAALEYDEMSESMPVERAFEEFGSTEANGLEAELPEPDRRRIFAVLDADQPDEDAFFEESPFGDRGNSFESFEEPIEPEEESDA